MNVPVAPEPTPKPEKNNTWKWLLVGCFGFVLLFGATGGIVAYKAYKSFNMSPAQVEAAAQEILPFEKPEGYEGKMSMSIMGMKMATLAPQGGQHSENLVMLMTVPGGRNNQANLRSNMERQNAGKNISAQKLPPQTFKVRGKDTTAEVQKLAPAQGAPSLQYVLFVDSPKGDLVLLLLQGAEATATHDWVQKFLDTVK